MGKRVKRPYEARKQRNFKRAEKWVDKIQGRLKPQDIELLWEAYSATPEELVERYTADLVPELNALALEIDDNAEENDKHLRLRHGAFCAAKFLAAGACVSTVLRLLVERFYLTNGQAQRMCSIASKILYSEDMKAALRAEYLETIKTILDRAMMADEGGDTALRAVALLAKLARIDGADDKVSVDVNFNL